MNNQKRALREIVEVDCAKLKKRSDKYVEMDDGTRYYIFTTFNHVRGYCIDQLIVVDDERWRVYKKSKKN